MVDFDCGLVPWLWLLSTQLREGNLDVEVSDSVSPLLTQDNYCE